MVWGMPTIARVQMLWHSFQGAPGYTNFHVFEGQIAEFQVGVKTFASWLVTRIPPSVGITVPNSGDVFDEATGALTGEWSSGTQSDAGGVAAGDYAAAAGACITWRTGAVVNGRRVIGRSFFVPIAGQYFGADGALDSTVAADFLANGNDLIGATAAGMVVYHRPKPVGSGTGVGAVVTSCTVPSKGANLRSRRD